MNEQGEPLTEGKDSVIDFKGKFQELFREGGYMTGGREIEEIGVVKSGVNEEGNSFLQITGTCNRMGADRGRNPSFMYSFVPQEASLYLGYSNSERKSEPKGGPHMPNDIDLDIFDIASEYIKSKARQQVYSI